LHNKKSPHKVFGDLTKEQLVTDKSVRCLNSTERQLSELWSNILNASQPNQWRKNPSWTAIWRSKPDHNWRNRTKEINDG